MVDVANINNFVANYSARSAEGLNTIKQKRAEIAHKRDSSLLQRQVSEIHEINAHSDLGRANTPEHVRSHLDSLPSIANPLDPKTVAMRGYASAAGRLASSF